MDVDHQDHKYCSTTESAALDLVLDHTEDLCTEITRLQKQSFPLLALSMTIKQHFINYPTTGN